MPRQNKNDAAWQLLFEKYDILKQLQEDNFFSISARQINEFREARLMAKFDTKEMLPDLFRKHRLNINAVSNGAYVIFKDPEHKSFLSLPDFKKLKPVPFSPSLPFPLDTLEFSTEMPESKAIDFAHCSGLLQQYLGEEKLVLTTRGRGFSDTFEITLGSEIGSLKVEGVQIEVDAGYEGENQFLIIEAKSSTRNTFNIRQLYYPLQHFRKKTNKPIRTVLLSFSNGVYYFTELVFTGGYYDYHIKNTTAIELVLDPQPVKKTLEVLLQQPVRTIQAVPVPQADDLNKVVDVLGLLNKGPADKYELAAFFDFTDRQGDYYGNAAAWLGLAEKKKERFCLSSKGKALVQVKNRDKRNEILVEAILGTKLFNELLRESLGRGASPTDEQIVEKIMQEGYNAVTAQRRKSTIKAWLAWMEINFLNR